MITPGIAVKSFIVNDDKLLIVKRSLHDVQKPDTWEIPGGRLNSGEDPYEGLKRETKEETNLDIDILHPINVRHFTRDDGQAITMLIFLCKAKGDINDIILSKEHSAYEWSPLDVCKEKLGIFFHKDVDMFIKFNKID